MDLVRAGAIRRPRTRKVPPHNDKSHEAYRSHLHLPRTRTRGPHPGVGRRRGRVRAGPAADTAVPQRSRRRATRTDHGAVAAVDGHAGGGRHRLRLRLALSRRPADDRAEAALGAGDQCGHRRIRSATQVGRRRRHVHDGGGNPRNTAGGVRRCRSPALRQGRTRAAGQPARPSLAASRLRGAGRPARCRRRSRRDRSPGGRAVLDAGCSGDGGGSPRGAVRTPGRGGAGQHGRSRCSAADGGHPGAGLSAHPGDRQPDQRRPGGRAARRRHRGQHRPRAGDRRNRVDHRSGLGPLAGAALDVFETEPLPGGSPLWDLPNVLVSPHSASTAANENAFLTELFIDNLHRYLAGEPLRNLYHADRGY